MFTFNENLPEMYDQIQEFETLVNHPKKDSFDVGSFCLMATMIWSEQNGVYASREVADKDFVEKYRDLIGSMYGRRAQRWMRGLDLELRSGRSFLSLCLRKYKNYYYNQEDQYFREFFTDLLVSTAKVKKTPFIHICDCGGALDFARVLEECASRPLISISDPLEYYYSLCLFTLKYNEIPINHFESITDISNHKNTYDLIVLSVRPPLQGEGGDSSSDSIEAVTNMLTTSGSALCKMPAEILEHAASSYAVKRLLERKQIQQIIYLPKNSDDLTSQCIVRIEKRKDLSGISCISPVNQYTKWGTNTIRKIRQNIESGVAVNATDDDNLLDWEVSFDEIREQDFFIYDRPLGLKQLKDATRTVSREKADTRVLDFKDLIERSYSFRDYQEMKTKLGLMNDLPDDWEEMFLEPIDREAEYVGEEEFTYGQAVEDWDADDYESMLDKQDDQDPEYALSRFLYDNMEPYNEVGSFEWYLGQDTRNSLYIAINKTVESMTVYSSLKSVFDRRLLLFESYVLVRIDLRSEVRADYLKGLFSSEEYHHALIGKLIRNPIQQDCGAFLQSLGDLPIILVRSQYQCAQIVQDTYTIDEFLTPVKSQSIVSIFTHNYQILNGQSVAPYYYTYRKNLTFQVYPNTQLDEELIHQDSVLARKVNELFDFANTLLSIKDPTARCLLGERLLMRLAEQKSISSSYPNNIREFTIRLLDRFYAFIKGLIYTNFNKNEIKFIITEYTGDLLGTSIDVTLQVQNRGNQAVYNMELKIDGCDETFYMGYLNSGEAKEIFTTIDLGTHDKDHISIPLVCTCNDLSGEAVFIEEIMEITYSETDKDRSFLNFKNPYIEGDPISIKDKAMFFGRQDIMDAINDCISGRVHASTVFLEGNRRIGKSSILQQISANDKIADWEAVFFDLQKVPVDEGQHSRIASATFYRSLILTIYTQLSHRGYDIFFPSSAVKESERNIMVFRKHLRGFFDEENPYESFLEYIRYVVEIIAPKKLLFLIDEFDRLLEGAEGQDVHPVITNLRHLLQHTDSVSAILSAGRLLRGFSNNYFSSLYGLAKTIIVSELDTESALRLIKEPVAGVIEYSHKALETIIQQTHCLPLLIQSICSTVCIYARKNKTRSITSGIVDTILADISESNEYFETLWSSIPNDLSRLLLFLFVDIPDEDVSLRIKDLINYVKESRLTFPAYQVQDAVKLLIEMELIVLDNDRQTRYLQRLPLFTKWMRKNCDKNQIIARLSHIGV